MIHKGTAALLCGCLFFGLAAATGYAQAPSSKDQSVDERASAYYNFAMGHLYAELAGVYGNRGEYVDKAIEHYTAALKADPKASFITEELAELYLQSGRLRDAIAEAEQMLARNPENLEARKMLGRIYSRMIGDAQQTRLSEENLRKAIEQFSAVTAKDPKDADSWLMLGRLYKVQQNSVESEKAYKKALEIDPKNEYALYGLATVYSDLGNTTAAVEMWRRLAEANPNPRSLRALAGAHEQMRDYAGAAEALKKALEMAPQDPEIKRDLAENLLMSDSLDESLKLFTELAAAYPKDAHFQLRLSQIHRQKGDFAKAREAQRNAIGIDPDNIEIRYNEVNLLDAEGKTGEAVAALDAIVKQTERKTYSPAEKSNRAILLERLGLLYRAADRFDEAVKTFESMAELDPNHGPRAAAQVLDTYRSAKQYDKAVAYADQVSKKYPNDRTLTMVRASLLADVGRFDEAANETRKLLGGERDREIYLALAQVYEKAKGYDQMGKALDEAEKLSPSADEKETIYFMRGAMYERMKAPAEAEAQFRKVLELNPRNAAALNYLGYMFADQKIKLEEAHRLVSKALEIEPNNGAYLDSLGWVYFRMGRLQEAENATLASLERVGRDPTVHDHLGDIYFEQGKIKEAIAQWQLSLREWETSSQAEKDTVEVAKIQKKLESAKVRLAKESSAVAAPHR